MDFIGFYLFSLDVTGFCLVSYYSLWFHDFRQFTVCIPLVIRNSIDFCLFFFKLYVKLNVTISVPYLREILRSADDFFISLDDEWPISLSLSLSLLICSCCKKKKEPTRDTAEMITRRLSSPGPSKKKMLLSSVGFFFFSSYFLNFFFIETTGITLAAFHGAGGGVWKRIGTKRKTKKKEKRKTKA